MLSDPFLYLLEHETSFLSWRGKVVISCRKAQFCAGALAPSQMRGWPGMWEEAYLALDFFPKGCLWHWFFFVPACAKPLRRRHGQDKKNVMFIIQRIVKLL